MSSCWSKCWEVSVAVVLWHRLFHLRCGRRGSTCSACGGWSRSDCAAGFQWLAAKIGELVDAARFEFANLAFDRRIFAPLINHSDCQNFGCCYLKSSSAKHEPLGSCGCTELGPDLGQAGVLHRGCRVQSQGNFHFENSECRMNSILVCASAMVQSCQFSSKSEVSK